LTSPDRLITKKSRKKETSAPVLTVNDARVKILSAELLLHGDTVTKHDGETFVVEKPHIACEMELIDAPKRKAADIGTTWFEKLYYPEIKVRNKKTKKLEGTGEFENRGGTKIGAITEARYGEDCWDNDTILDPDDLVDFEFYCNLVPKTEFGGTKVLGTRIDHDSVESVEDDEFTPPADAPEAPDFSKIEGEGK
jgi:hypothetical protein